MARTHNPDHYKVSGSQVEDSDRARASRAKLGYQAAMLSHANKRNPMLAPKAAIPKGKQAVAKKARAKPETTELRSTPLPSRIPKQQPVAEVHTIHSDKVKHGKKRRSAKKRHEVGVLQEIRAQGGASTRTESARNVPVAAMPNAPPRRELGGVVGFAWRQFKRGGDMLQSAKDFVAAPFTLVRVIRGLRDRNVRQS